MLRSLWLAARGWQASVTSRCLGPETGMHEPKAHAQPCVGALECNIIPTSCALLPGRVPRGRPRATAVAVCTFAVDLLAMGCLYAKLSIPTFAASMHCRVSPSLGCMWSSCAGACCPAGRVDAAAADA
jgi:hypothetical protein